MRRANGEATQLERLRQFHERNIRDRRHHRVRGTAVSHEKRVSSSANQMVARAAAVSGFVPTVTIYHNILWSRYKGAVFSALDSLSNPATLQLRFVQIAATDGDQAALSAVDLRYHNYPYELLYTESYGSISTVRLVARLSWHVARGNADLVVLPGYHKLEYWAMLLVCIVLRKRRAVFCDSTKFDRPHGRLKAFLKRAFFSRCQAFFGYGRRSGEYLIENGANPAGVFTGCQAAALPISFDADAALARRISSRRNAPEATFLFVGRLAKEKDIPTLIKAFAAFRTKTGAGKLVLVGSGPELPNLMAFSQQLGVSEHVDFAGARDVEALSDFYARALCLVLPSISEPWGLVVNEALHHGCPVIVSEVCGCRPDLVVDNYTGFAFTSGVAGELAQRMLLVSTELANPEVVGRQCQHMMAQFGPEHAAAQILRGCELTLGAGIR